MTKPCNIKAKLITAQHKGNFITYTILEVHQYYHGYVVNGNVKNCALATCPDLCNMKIVIHRCSVPKLLYVTEVCVCISLYIQN